MRGSQAWSCILRRRFVCASNRTIATLPRPSESLLNTTSAHWQSLVSPPVGEALLNDGYCVIPGAFPPQFTKMLRDEMTYLHETKQMYANSTHIMIQGEQNPTLLEKHHILETELVLPQIRQQVPTLEWFFDSQQVFQAIERVTPSWLELSRYMVKLQYNQGHGGCFPMHFDSYGDDGKCITAVLYLNEHWQEGDGGEIVLYPFPQHQEPVVVPPLDGQLVLFSSQQMLHRVLPATKPRFCLTTWIYASPTSKTRAASASHYQTKLPPSEYKLQVLEKIVRSSFRRHVAKLYYGDEWASSLHESHLQTDEFAKYMATHEREVAMIETATAQMLSKFRAKDPAQPSSLPADAETLVQALQRDDKIQKLLRDVPIAWF